MNTLKLVLSVLFLVCGWLGASPAEEATAKAPTAVRTVRDIAYVSGGSERQKLDLYLPGGGNTAPKPLVIWIHGGGWENGDKSNCPARALVPYGYAAASLGYRLSQQAIFPAQIEDCKAAIRFLRAHASEYGIDPERIGVWGGSAGGHLVALLGTTGDIRDFDVGENLAQSSRVQCVVDWFGPADFLHWGDVIDERLDRPENAVSHLLGGTVGTHEELAWRASPVSFVNRGDAPFLIMHGEQDQLVPVQQSKELDETLRKAGVESTLKIVSGAGHGGAAFTSPESRKAILEFFDKHLRAASETKR